MPRLIGRAIPALGLAYESSTYGTATRWTQPADRPDLGDFGLSAGVGRLPVNVLLESDGQRASARWLWKPKP